MSIEIIGLMIFIYDIEGIEIGEVMDCLCCLEGDLVRIDLMLGGRLFISVIFRVSRI